MITFNVDTSELMKLAGLNEAAQRAIQGAAGDLAKMAHAKMIEEAKERLHTRREMFIEGVSKFQVDDTTWIVQVDASVRWINDGLQAHNMIEQLVSGPNHKVSKDGHRYAIIPFDHSNGGATQATPAQQDLVSTIKSAMKSKGIPFKGIEVDKEGNPKLGVLHRFDITNKPLKTDEGPGQGKGPIGAVRQGHTGIPFLQGLQVSQGEHTDKEGRTSVKKSITTFRVASEAQPQSMWNHPGVPATNIFETTAEWIRNEWDREIAPQLLARIMRSL